MLGESGVYPQSVSEKGGHEMWRKGFLALAVLMLFLGTTVTALAWGWAVDKVDFPLVCNKPEYEVARIYARNNWDIDQAGHIHWRTSTGWHDTTFTIPAGANFYLIGLWAEPDTKADIYFANVHLNQYGSITVVGADSFCFGF